MAPTQISTTDPGVDHPSQTSHPTMFRDTAVSPVTGGVTPTLTALRRPQALGVVALLLLVTGVFIWAVLARPATTITGIGLLADENTLSQSVAPATGMVHEVLFDRTSAISAGDVMATIRTADNDMVSVAAYDDATVLLRLIEPGTWVEAGQPIAELIRDTEISSAVAAIDEQDAAALEVGQRALVSVRQAPAAQFGSIPATVAWVTAVPVGADRLTLLAGGNERLASELDTATGVVLVGLTLETDTSNVTGLRWTAGNGPSTALAPAAIIDVDIISGTVVPAELLISQ